MKKGLCQFLYIPIIYHSAKNQKKLISHFWEKHQTDGHTDRHRQTQTMVMVLGLLNQLLIFSVVSDRIVRAFNRSGATQSVALDISKAFDRVWHTGLLHKLKSYGISGQIFGLISSFLSNRQIWVVLDGKSSKKYPDNAGIPQGSILGPSLFPCIH